MGNASPVMPAESMGDPMTFPPTVRSHGPHTATDSTREGSSTGTLRHGEVPPIISGTTPYPGSGYVSLSPHRDGRPLILSNPPSRPGSVNGGSHIQHDPPCTQLTSPPSLSSKSSVTPNIQFDRLKGVLPAEQLSELRRLISHHGIQRQKLVSAGSALNELREEAHNMRTSAESLTGRVDRVLYDTIQVMQDRDIVISSIGRVFDDALEPQVGTDNIGPSGNTPEHNSSEIPAPDIGHSDHSHNTAPRGADHLPDDCTLRSEPDYKRASQRILNEMHREFPPCRADEDEIQYWNRYQVHQQLINNTQWSWDKSGHDAPPHLPSTNYRNTNAPVPYLMIIFVKDRHAVTLTQHTHNRLRTGHMSSLTRHLGHTTLAKTHGQITDLTSRTNQAFPPSRSAKGHLIMAYGTLSITIIR
jgi:hypothetical protein